MLQPRQRPISKICRISGSVLWIRMGRGSGLMALSIMDSRTGLLVIYFQIWFIIKCVIQKVQMGHYLLLRQSDKVTENGIQCIWTHHFHSFAHLQREVIILFIKIKTYKNSISIIIELFILSYPILLFLYKGTWHFRDFSTIFLVFSTPFWYFFQEYLLRKSHEHNFL